MNISYIFARYTDSCTQKNAPKSTDTVADRRFKELHTAGFALAYLALSFVFNSSNDRLLLFFRSAVCSTIRNRIDVLLRVICTRFLSNASRKSAAVPGCRYVVRASLLLSGHDARQPSRFSACARSRVERRTRQGWNEMR